ncbi:MAG TPA: elongation factor G [Firmicutes bacterium]|nr:elongation factor G [Bacillota bacterium]
MRKPELIRNLALASHGGAGKTSLAEAMLFRAGAVDRLGRVDEGNATMDFDPEEVKRKVSISTSVAPLEWGGCKINLIDTPGYFDFVGEVKAGMRVAEAVCILCDAVAGVEVGTELVGEYARDAGLPVLFFANKMDRENANFTRTLESLRDNVGQAVIPLTVPIGAEARLRGVVDVIGQKAWLWEGDKPGNPPKEGPVPEDMAGEVAGYRAQLMEAAAEGSDDFLMKYLEGEELGDQEMWQGLAAAFRQRKVFPLLAGSAVRVLGIDPLLDAVVKLVPSAATTMRGENQAGEAVERRADPGEPFSALVFKTTADPYVGKLSMFRVYSGTVHSDTHVFNAAKGRAERIGQLFFMKGKNQEATDEVGPGDIATVAKLQETSTGDTLCDANNPVRFAPIAFPSPVFAVAVAPKTRGDEEKISASLARLAEEDPTFRVEKNAATGQMLVYGMGELHIDIIVDRLRRKFGVEVNLDAPRVPYKETIRQSVKSEYKHKKQTGGRGQYGHVFLEIEPAEGRDFEFGERLFGGSVPRQYVPAVEKGVREALQEGVVAGYPVTDVKVTLYDGSYHTVDSSEMAFKIAASMAFKKGMQEAKPVLLEPIQRVEVMVPEAFMGDVMGDLNKKRGRILGMEPHGSFQVIKALVPLAEMFRYAIDLRSITQGRGTFSMEFDHYEEVPAHLAQEVIAQAKAEREAAEK